MKSLQIPLKLVYKKFYVHEKNYVDEIYQKVTSWKTHRKHVNQTSEFKSRLNKL